MRRGLLCTVLLGVLAWCSAALAYNPYSYLGFRMVHSEEGPFRYYLDDRQAKPAGIEIAQVETALTAAWSTWSTALGEANCAPPVFEYAGRIGTQATDVGNPYDRFNVSAVWITSREDPYYDFALAGGRAAISTIPLAYGGYLYQCDIYLNGTGDVRWSTLPTTPEGYLDLQSFLLREVGHCLGLENGAEPRDRVMSWELPVGVSRRQLTAADIEHACTLYPAAGSTVGAACTAAGACDAGLTCVTAEGVNGQQVRLCTKGCTGTTNGECPDPFACKPSTLVEGSENACLPAAGNYVTLTGKACDDAAQCGSVRAFCQLPSALPSGGTAWVGGYCSETCTEGGGECGSSAICAPVGSGLRCLQKCRSGTGDCRSGYACSPLPEGNACVPACYTESDCPTDYACRPCDRVCVRKQKVGVAIGEACNVDADCGTSQVCLHPNGHPQGICAQPCETAACSCPSGSSCQYMGTTGASMCIRSCTAGTCGTGMQCAPFPDGSSGCLPTCRTGADCPYGSSCGSNGQCVSATSPPDAGTCSLCGDGGTGSPDAGVGKPDAGPGGSGSSGPGCGCQGSAASASGFLGTLVLLLVAGRRRRCQRP
ncbi:MAG TPA: adhesin [Myxococcaceae bacterium]|nr:adhesin [Myxococcaceae bacterium]